MNGKEKEYNCINCGANDNFVHQEPCGSLLCSECWSMNIKEKEHSFIYKMPSTWLGRLIERFNRKIKARYVIGYPGASTKVYGKSDLIKMYGKDKASQIIENVQKQFNKVD